MLRAIQDSASSPNPLRRFDAQTRLMEMHRAGGHRTSSVRPAMRRARGAAHLVGHDAIARLQTALRDFDPGAVAEPGRDRDRLDAPMLQYPHLRLPPRTAVERGRIRRWLTRRREAQRVDRHA